MSDRRPENQDQEDRELIEGFLDAAGFDYGMGNEGSAFGVDLVIHVFGRLVDRPDPYRRESADLVAAVRRGVESGTIEGEVVHTLKEPYQFRVKVHKAGKYLVIPVDGGVA